jgi:glycine cleavage system H protein
MSSPDDLRYTDKHEWVRGTDSKVVVGITDFAQSALGAVVHIEFPEIGAAVVSGEPCAEIESTKSVSEIYSPASGRVVAVNAALSDQPEVVNDDCYGGGWLLELDVDPATFASLLSSTEYDALIETQGDGSH